MREGETREEGGKEGGRGEREGEGVREVRGERRREVHGVEEGKEGVNSNVWGRK